MNKKQTLTPHETAFNKAYFVNLFAAKDNVYCNDFCAAKLHYPRIAKIAESLSPLDLKYLIDKIEEIQ